MNLLDGRITFTLSLACGLWCLVAAHQHPSPAGRAVAAALAGLTFLASPLGGLFLLLAVLTAAVVSAAGRPRMLALTTLLFGSAVAAAALFPGLGRMPFESVDALPALGCTVAVVFGARHRWLRAGAVVYLVAMATFLVHPGAVGLNITRLAWVFAVPLLVAYGTVGRRQLAVLVTAAALLPSVDIGRQLATAYDESARRSFYEPLLGALAVQRAARPESAGQRVEVVDPRSHWASVYVGEQIALARGWERQADRADNPLFYPGGRLDRNSYRAWLDELAVGWVAVPNAPLDYASVAEARLIASRLDYLEPVWSDADWQLFRVIGSRPLVTSPARVVALDDRSVTLGVPTGGEFHLSVRWSPYLTVETPAGARAGCVRRDGRWTVVRVPGPGVYLLTSEFRRRLVDGARLCG